MTDFGKELLLDDLVGLIKHPCGLYVTLSNDWYLKHYKHESYGKGDIIYQTLRKIIEDNDKSEWAYQAFEICAGLLFERRRWPVELDNDNDAHNWLVYRWSYLKFKVKYKCKMKKHGPVPWPRLYRPHGNVTRDPYIYLYACAVHLNRLQFIEVVTIPPRLYSRRTWLWREVLIQGERNARYEQLDSKDHSQDYAQLLKHYRMKSYKLRTQTP